MYDVEHEAARVREAYGRRDTAHKASLYAWDRPDSLLIQYRHLAAMARAMAEHGWRDLGRLECLDIGCGVGLWLRRLAEWGANPARLHGVELLADRIERARQLSPGIDFRLTNGWPIPFETGSMALVSASTVFSSILDPMVRQALADEMQRVLRPDGMIMVYDFRVSNPRNADTVGIGVREMRRLFPKLIVSSRLMTLAPPLLRPLARMSGLLAHAVEVICPFLATHALHVIRVRRDV
jgi:SAM-dependent methyltransferase